MSGSNDAFEVDMAMLSLFRSDVASQVVLLENSLLAFQAGVDVMTNLLRLVEASHIIAGTARMVCFPPAVELANALERFFLEVQQATCEIDYSLLFNAIGQFKAISKLDDAALEKIVRQPINPEMAGLAHAISLLLRSQPQKGKAISVVSPTFLPHKEVIDEEISDSAAIMDLFRVELENQSKILIECIVSIEQGENVAVHVLKMLRAVHSIKGAAQIVRLEPIARLAHVVEEVLASARNNPAVFDGKMADKLLQCVDIFTRVSHISHSLIAGWVKREMSQISSLTEELSTLLSVTAYPAGDKMPRTPSAVVTISDKEQESQSIQERVVRITAQRLSRLMDLAGESLIESRRLYPINESMVRLKKGLNELTTLVETFKDRFEEKIIGEVQETYWEILHKKAAECQEMLNKRLPELSMHISRYSMLTDQLYHNVIDSRMRPFGDAVESFPRLARDLAQQLNKKVRLNIIGKSTPVDRDILEKLETPLVHLLRNAIDHGVEPPEKRIALGKPAEGVVRIEARHQAGMLSISVFDDGGGVDAEDIKKRIIERGLMNSDMVERLSESKLVDFLFMSGFTTAEQVTAVSGRGVGLDAVKNMIHEVAGSIRADFVPGKGMSFNMLLPLTLSIVRCLVVEIAGEPYAFPLTRIERLFLIPRQKLETIEKMRYFNHEGKNIGLVWASDLMGLGTDKELPAIVPVILLKERKNLYGVVTDRFIGEKELVVRELDPRLGTLAYISAGAIKEDGNPILIIDAENLMRMVDSLPMERTK